MPYHKEERDGKTCVIKDDDGQVMGCHDTEGEADEQIAALYANEDDKRGKNLPDDVLVSFGGAVKALGDGRIAGYLVRYGNPDEPDLTGEFFTGKTDFGADDWPHEVPVYYRHGLDATMGKKRLGRAQVKADDEGVGLWVEAQLNLRDKWERAVYKLAEAGKLGWSSGSAINLTEKEPAGKAFFLKHWPIVEASVTPDPAEPRGTAVMPLKSLQLEAPSLEELEAKCCGCAMPVDYQEDLPADMTIAALSRLNDQLWYRVVYQAVRDRNTPLAERLASLRAAFDRHRDAALAVIEAILANADALEVEAAAKSIKSLWGSSSTSVRGLGSGSLTDHSEAVASANSEYARRLGERLETRVKAGRVLSAANVAELESVLQSLQGLKETETRLVALLEKAKPKDAEADTEGDDQEGARLHTEFLRRQLADRRQSLGV